MRRLSSPRVTVAFIATLALAGGVAGCGGGTGGSLGGTGTASAQPGMGRPAVTLGTKGLTEQIVLGQLYEQALEAKGFTVALKQSIGSTAIAAKALRSGQIDLYPEYLGAFDRTVAGETATYSSVQSALAAGRAHAARHGLALLAPTPFTDAEAIAVLPAYARTHGLATIADLGSIAGLRIGAPPEFRLREAGLVGLERVYGLSGVRFAPLTVGLQYQVLDAGKLDAAAVRTTDGQLEGGGYVVLKDPKHLFGVQNVTLVVRMEVLRAEGPAFERTLDAVSAKLTTLAMQRLNAAVALDRRSPMDVAREFLRENGLV